MKKSLVTLGLALVCSGAFSQTATFPTSGDVGIGTTSPIGALKVIGTSSAAPEINADHYLNNFGSSTINLTLQEIEEYIKEKGHLPGIPSASEVKANGVDLGDKNAKLLQKIEELTLYITDLEKRVKTIEVKK